MEEQENTILENIRTLLKDKALQNTQRILILIALYLSKKLGFIDLARATGIDKGRLAYHLDILEEHKLVRRRRYLTLVGPRVYIEITDKGVEKVKEIIGLLSKLKQESRGESVE